MKRALLATLLTDSHSWNLVYLQIVLEELGYCVENLGPCTPAAVLLDRGTKEPPDLIIISSLNGSAFLDAIPLINEINRSARLRSVPVLIGGNLDTGERDERELCAAFVAAGFAAAFPRTSTVSDLRCWLEGHSEFQVTRSPARMG